MSEKWMTLVPSYGRDYATAEAVFAHWLEGRDFTICDVSSVHNGRQINLGDAERYEPETTFKIRYARLANFALIRRVENVWTLIGKEDGSQNEEISDDPDGGAEEDHGD
jgi:hypothetical protein